MWFCFAAAASFSFAAEIVLNPVADTYVRNSNPASALTQHFGTAANFIANNANGIRVSFLRFDLTGVPGPVTNARLELTVNLAAAGETFNVYGLTNRENWNENAITWSNAPAVITNYVSTTGTLAQYLKPADLFSNGLVLSTFTSGSAGTIDVAFNSNPAVLDFINSDSDKVITFVIAEPDPADTGGVAWNSRESAVGLPALIINTNTTSAPPPNTTLGVLHVLLQAGQSNSDGRAKTNGLPASLLQPQNDVPIYYYPTGGAANGDGSLGHLTTLRPGLSAQGGGAYFGPELSFGRTLADYFARSNNVTTNDAMVAIIKYAHGGTTLANDWKANGNSGTNAEGVDYLIFQQVVTAGLSNLANAYPNAAIQLDGMVWVQGESDIDAGTTTAAAYSTNLIRFINDIRLTYAAQKPYGTNLPFFLARISSNQTFYSLPADSGYAGYLILRAGQAAVAGAMNEVYMLDIDGAQFTTLTPGTSPGLHFDTAGQQGIGTAFGRAVIAAFPRPCLQMPAKIGSNWSLGFSGVPGTAQSLERAFNLSGPWTSLTNIVIGPLGETNYNDQIYPKAFYRVSRP